MIIKVINYTFIPVLVLYILFNLLGTVVSVNFAALSKAPAHFTSLCDVWVQSKYRRQS